MCTLSENKLRRHLNAAHISIGARDGPESRARGQIGIRIRKVRRVGRIKELETGLQRCAFGDGEVFKERDIRIYIARPGQDVPGRVARNTLTPGGGNEGLRVEILSQGALSFGNGWI